MLRTPQKRKLSESLNHNLKQDRCEGGTNINTEAEHDDGDYLPTATAIRCCLCNSSSGANQPSLFEAGLEQANPTTVEKIKICIGREVSSDTNPAARICFECRQELDMHHRFWKQSLQCNDYAQNQINAGEVPDEIGVCRFCLVIGGQLLDLFPDGGAPDEHQLGEIWECFAVEVNSMDPLTKICQTCIERIQEFLEFRASVLDEPDDPNALLEEEGQTKAMDLELEVSDSDCSMENEIERNIPSIRVKSKPGEIPPKIAKLLRSDLEGRNFSILLEEGEQMKVTFEGYPFRFHAMNKSSGGSLWYCLESKLQCCGLKVEIDPGGKSAYITSKCKKHGHPVARPKLMECPIGKGVVRSGHDSEPFWMFKSWQRGAKHSRSLIFESFRYFLYQCNTRTSISIWHCAKRGRGHCMALLEIEGIFQRVNMKGAHNHAVLEKEKIDMVLKASQIDLESTEAIDKFQKNNQFEPDSLIDKKVAVIKERKRAMQSLFKEKNPEIFKVLQEDDPERSFECVNAGSKLKIRKDGFEYRYFGSQEDKSTLWKCVLTSLRHCRMMAKISGDGKTFETFKGLRHSHTTEPGALFSYPLGKRMIGDEPLWLLKKISMYHESRSVIYQDYIFTLQDATQKGIVRWNCLKHGCPASLIVKGDFEDVNLRNDHSHEKTPQETIQRSIEGRPETLAPGENLTTKQRLLSFPSMKGKIWDEVLNEHETFFFLNLEQTGVRLGYGLIYRGYKYTFASMDQYGTSRWMCTKSEECRRIAIVEGIYESICVKEEHIHERMLDSQVDLMIQRSMNNTLSDAAEGSGLVEYSLDSNEPKNVLAMLTRKDPDRNFSVSRMKSKLLIHDANEEDFRLSSREPDGTSLWACTWRKLRKCPVALRLSADAKYLNMVDPQKKHNHSEEQIPFFYLPNGKAPVFDEYLGAHRFYWLFTWQSDYRTSRAIIYQGYKYHLHNIAANGISSWQCHSQNCRAFVRVEGCFKVISRKNHHIHDPLSNEEIVAITGLSEVDNDLLLDTCIDFLPPTEAPPLRPLTLLRLLSNNDPDRNFQVSTDKDKIKIIQNGYEYYYQSSNETHSHWKCIYSFIRRCHAAIMVDNHCKKGFPVNKTKHNHPVEPWDILRYPQGEHSIMDSSTATMKPFRYLMQPSFLRPYPILIYEQNKFCMTYITRNGDSSKWRCSGQACPATLTVTGLFGLLTVTGSPHNHEPLSDEKVTRWIQICGEGAADGEPEEYEEHQVQFVDVPMDNDGSLKLEIL